MSTYFEIAYAAASHRLCLFTGTGFSKAVTGNAAPGWQELLERVCDTLPNPATIKTALFPLTGKNPLSLEEAAQVISLELNKIGRNIHADIATQIRALALSGNNQVIADFLSTNPIRVVTTNYDKLAEALAGADCQSITPGHPIPRAPAKAKVYHVHGSIDSPANMVVTSDDYFRFMHGESYFSRKLSTVLHENTVVILGYSLADTNLKTIISDYKGFSRTHVIGGNLFLVSRSKVDQYVKDYYAHCYGIRVLDQLEMHDFFSQVNAYLPEAKKCAASVITDLRNVLYRNYAYNDDYLKIEKSFFEITAAVAALGLSINNGAVVAALDKVLQRKISFTSVNGAWEQYAHLARWLCHLGSILELPRTSIEKTFLNAVLLSMNSMSRNSYGSSWHAYTAWSNQWPDLLPPNRHLIRSHIDTHCHQSDARTLVATC